MRWALCSEDMLQARWGSQVPFWVPCPAHAAAFLEDQRGKKGEARAQEYADRQAWRKEQKEQLDDMLPKATGGSREARGEARVARRWGLARGGGGAAGAASATERALGVGDCQQSCCCRRGMKQCVSVHP